jgi:hypothetical protein
MSDKNTIDGNTAVATALERPWRTSLTRSQIELGPARLARGAACDCACCCCCDCDIVPNDEILKSGRADKAR